MAKDRHMQLGNACVCVKSTVGAHYSLHSSMIEKTPQKKILSADDLKNLPRGCGADGGQIERNLLLLLMAICLLI